MVERPWETPDDREKAERKAKADRNSANAVVLFFGGLIALVVLVVLLLVLGAF